MRNYLALVRTRAPYRRLWLAGAVSSTGDWFSLVAVSVLSVSSSTNGAMVALAGTLAAHLLPQALLAPVAGVIADRRDRRTVLIVGNLVECGLTLAMALAAVRPSLCALQALLVLRASVSALREPATGAALPQLVPKTELPAANALNAATWSFTFVAGMALGGVAAEIAPMFALALDAVTFLAGSLLLRGLPRMVPPTLSLVREAPPLELRERGGWRRAPWTPLMRMVGDVGQSVRALRDARLRAAVLGKTPVAMIAGVAWMALNVVARERPFALGAASSLGLLQAARGLGSAVGPILTDALSRRDDSRSKRRGWRSGPLAHVAAVIVGLGAVGLALSHQPISALGALPQPPRLDVGLRPTLIALASAFLWGVGGGALWVITMTEIQQRSDQGMRGRMLAVDSFGFTVAMSGSALVLAVALDRGASLAGATIPFLAVACGAWMLVRRQGGAARVDRLSAMSTR